MNLLKKNKNIRVLFIKMQIENFKNNSILTEIEEKVISMSKKLSSQNNTVQSLKNAAQNCHLLNQDKNSFPGNEIRLRSEWIARANLLKVNCQSKALIVEKKLQSANELKVQSRQRLINGRQKEEKLKIDLKKLNKSIEVVKDEIAIEDVLTANGRIKTSSLKANC